MQSKIMLDEIQADMQTPTLLHEKDGHAIYWLGITEESVFRCNVYLIVDGDEAILVDPGSRNHFEQVRARVSQIICPEKITGMILCHQDPDVAASMVDWLQLCPASTVFTSPRAQVLLPYFGVKDYAWHDIEDEPVYCFASGRKIRFVTAPFLHSPAAFTTYDESSSFLFSGDIWAALMTSWQLTVSEFSGHCAQMDIFHMDYMASNIAARGFVAKLDALVIDAILPQHGSIIPAQFVSPALEYLRALQCGTDIAYPA
ncbi:MAG: MBL fold metallo-hydrolase [Zetaproteobacteria bacterium CG_4_9_14_3_um_filter_49_83]|nr:MAG: MBL fold metallo-hydrolase [Zetaproteobacteria bacterium CG1_02_49_23]PIQ34408.1 MAG: MBL fold metallo-hydrolase [Zetaproteobacteria bacterium CG17_big_fil_post_rev_8_21_14_2_50_50_13]PIV30276.1 MAG: MBL fold metallo-hydrolase [Zetaproteobacteria bacterium CG02_land_8_20_14_3_00_50_9]PIY56392.1 MAG: MBL fold metallo-hydrolase [Zetaproteobacteria bacterium CG_4_10_14_0_8_um_filter_49_80]PJA34032.1 MAG: MBL fold metallo-hydrolase [Zetaproteobacteria bacterium CG_4_9_14_3_um_filter_49_83]